MHRKCGDNVLKACPHIPSVDWQLHGWLRFTTFKFNRLGTCNFWILQVAACFKQQVGQITLTYFVRGSITERLDSCLTVSCFAYVELDIDLQVWSWSTLVEGGKERYQPPGKLTLELVLANQKKTFMFMDYPAYQVGR